MTWLRRLLVVLSVGCSRAALAADSESAPPAAQQSTVPLHDVGVGLAVGFEHRPDGWTFGMLPGVPGPIVSASNTLGILQPTVAWSPLEWLEISFLVPGLTALLGSRNHDEVLLSAGVIGLGYGSEEGWIVVPAAGAAYRHWFSGATSVGVTAGWSGQYSQLSPVLQLSGSVFFTQTVGGWVSFNLGLEGGGWPSQSFELSQPFELALGSATLGLRRLPLVRFHLSSVWSIEVDARLLLRFRGQPWGTLVGEQVLLGFSAIW